jgi:hypothetical protein
MTNDNQAHEVVECCAVYAKCDTGEYYIEVWPNDTYGVSYVPVGDDVADLRLGVASEKAYLEWRSKPHPCVVVWQPQAPYRTYNKTKYKMYMEMFNPDILGRTSPYTGKSQQAAMERVYTASGGIRGGTPTKSDGVFAVVLAGDSKVMKAYREILCKPLSTRTKRKPEQPQKRRKIAKQVRQRSEHPGTVALPGAAGDDNLLPRLLKTVAATTAHHKPGNVVFDGLQQEVNQFWQTNHVVAADQFAAANLHLQAVHERKAHHILEATGASGPALDAAKQRVSDAHHRLLAGLAQAAAERSRTVRTASKEVVHATLQQRHLVQDRSTLTTIQKQEAKVDKLRTEKLRLQAEVSKKDVELHNEEMRLKLLRAQHQLRLNEQGRQLAALSLEAANADLNTQASVDNRLQLPQTGQILTALCSPNLDTTTLQLRLPAPEDSEAGDDVE